MLAFIGICPILIIAGRAHGPSNPTNELASNPTILLSTTEAPKGAIPTNLVITGTL